MTFYGDTSKAALLAGVDSAAITVAMQEVINNWINTNIKFDGFDAVEIEVMEYYDIRKHGQSELILRHFPVTTISEIKDAWNTENAKVLEPVSYVIDQDTGILQLVGRGNSMLLNDQSNGYVVTNTNLRPGCFTMGMSSVKITYKYGWASIPPIIVQIANLMAARWAKIKSVQADANGLGNTSVRIGDYSESLDYQFKGVASEFDEFLNPMIVRAQAFYNQGV